jgi:hypothetical protein
MNLRQASFTFVLLALSTFGCAASPAPLRVKASDLRGREELGQLTQGRPIDIELVPGDTIPLYVTVEGDLVRGPEAVSPTTLVVKERFFLRISKDGVKTSRDGTFRDAPVTPGAFRFGIGVTKEQGLRADVDVRTPSHPR